LVVLPDTLVSLSQPPEENACRTLYLSF